jgi:hypothetical protein
VRRDNEIRFVVPASRLLDAAETAPPQNRSAAAANCVHYNRLPKSPIGEKTMPHRNCGSKRAKPATVRSALRVMPDDRLSRDYGKRAMSKDRRLRRISRLRFCLDAVPHA